MFFVDETDLSYLCLSSDEGKHLGTHQHKRSLSLSLSAVNAKNAIYRVSLSLSLSLSFPRATTVWKLLSFCDTARVIILNDADDGFFCFRVFF